MDFFEFTQAVRDQRLALAREGRRSAVVEVPRVFEQDILNTVDVTWNDEAGDPPRTPLSLENGRICGIPMTLVDGDAVRVIPAEG